MELHEEIGAVRREITLPAGRERAWACLSDPRELAGWLGDDVELTAVAPGAEGRVDGRVTRVEEVVEQRRVVLSWCAPGEDPSLVELVLDDAGDGATRLVVVEAPLVRLHAAGTALQREVRAAQGPRLLACA